MKSSSSRQHKLVLVTFLLSSVFSLILLASLPVNWGVAYGQTAGPGGIIVTKTFSPASPRNGDTLTFTLTVLNSGNLPIKNLDVTDVVPDRFEVNGATSNKGTVKVAGQRVNVTADSLAPGDTIQVIITTLVKSGNERSIRNVVMARFIETVGQQNREQEVDGAADVPLEALDSANRGVTPVIPGLPNTGVGTQLQLSTQNQAGIPDWKIIALIVFGLISLGSLLIILLTRKSKRV